MEWKIKRGESEFAAPDTSTLQTWAKEGRVVATDYVLNPTLNRWMYARELAELTGYLALPVDRQASRGSCGLAAALFLFAVLLGVLGMGESIAILLGAGAFVCGLLAAILYAVGK